MNAKTIHIEGRDVAFQQEGEDTILRAGLRAGLGFPHECNAGGCGSCKFTPGEGEIETLWADPPGLTAVTGKRDLCWPASAAPNRTCGSRSACPRSMSRAFCQRGEWRNFASIHGITHDLREFRFQAEGAAEFLAGQYAAIEFPGLGSSRCYSMSNIANERGEWHFQIRRLPGGKGTGLLFEELKEGDEVEIDGPYGLAWLKEDSPRSIVCVAGGSGLAPMVSIARGASAAGLLKTRELHYFYGARSPRDICGESFLRELPEFGSRFHFYPAVSSPEQEPGAGWNGETGYIHDAVERRLANNLDNFEFYFSGPPPMTRALQEMLMVNMGAVRTGSLR